MSTRSFHRDVCAVFAQVQRDPSAPLRSPSGRTHGSGCFAPRPRACRIVATWSIFRRGVLRPAIRQGLAGSGFHAFYRGQFGGQVIGGNQSGNPRQPATRVTRQRLPSAPFDRSIMHAPPTTSPGNVQCLDCLANDRPVRSRISSAISTRCLRQSQKPRPKASFPSTRSDEDSLGT